LLLQIQQIRILTYRPPLQLPFPLNLTLSYNFDLKTYTYSSKIFSILLLLAKD
jgi:hypothetical protein